MTVKATIIDLRNRGIKFAIHKVENILNMVLNIPRRSLEAAKHLFRYVVNVYTLFWCLKCIQEKIVDPFLDISIGMSTLDGWKNERHLRYIPDETQSSVTSAAKNKEIAHKKKDAKNTKPTSNQLKFEKSAQLITIWWGLAKRKDADSVDFRSDVIYTHSKFLHPSLVLSSNKITLHGISNGQVIFNVSDELAEDLDEVVEAEDAQVEVGRMQFVIQTIATMSLWLPKKVFDHYWTRKRVIILPSWAFNKLILVSNPSLKQILQTGPTECLSPTKATQIHNHLPHHPDREGTIFAYIDNLGEIFEEFLLGLNWKWRALISTVNIYIAANKQAFKLASKSAKGVTSVLATASTYILANV